MSGPAGHRAADSWDGRSAAEHVTAHVAVIGAGAVGLAVAVELRRAGVDDVVVVEANSTAGRGSSSRANGGVRAQFTTAVNIAFSRFTIAGLADLDRTSGGLVGLRRVGYLFMTGTEPGEQALRKGQALQRSLGVEVRWLTPAEILDIAPFIRPHGLRAGTFCADDGILDPAGVVAALNQEARRLGVRCLFDERVVALECGNHKVRLRSTRVSVDAAHVVNAAGPGAAEVAALAGVELPVKPYRRNLACTEPVAGFADPIPMCVDLDTGVLVRREAGGFLLACADPTDPPSADTTFDPAFLDALAQRVGNRFPFLADVAINHRKCWAGLYPQTPDHHAIIDFAKASRRIIHCAGFGGHGIMHSLAAGRAVAELVRDGRCTTFDLAPLRLSRFAEGALTIETAVL
ncbi:MAG TPA: FAD-dependent oxidoreductase [Candidatus Dormibacteraeota bacterium]